MTASPVAEIAPALISKIEFVLVELNVGMRRRQEKVVNNFEGIYCRWCDLEDLNSVKKIDPLFPALLLVAEAQGNIALGRYEMAFGLAEQHLQRNPESAQAMLNYITAAWNLEMYDDALWQYEEIKLRASNRGLPIFEYIKKQAWDPKVKKIIQKTIETIEAQ